MNPARQFGPAVLSLETVDLWIYLVAPVLGAGIGAAVNHMIVWRLNGCGVLTYKLAGDLREPNG
jgi:hypothetical protein